LGLELLKSENFVVLGRYVASVGRWLLTFREDHIELIFKDQAAQKVV
jgi:hypothetical protein